MSDVKTAYSVYSRLPSMYDCRKLHSRPKYKLCRNYRGPAYHNIKENEKNLGHIFNDESKNCKSYNTQCRMIKILMYLTGINFHFTVQGKLFMAQLCGSKLFVCSGGDCGCLFTLLSLVAI